MKNNILNLDVLNIPYIGCKLNETTGYESCYNIYIAITECV
jgi:hypothetical protein